jgi:flagellar protein FlgJ
VFVQFVELRPKDECVSIKPPSDILLDVARAADPAKSTAAVERLTRLGADGGVDDAQFRDILGKVNAPRSPSLPAIAELRFANMQPEKVKETAQTKAYQGFTALLLENLVDNMMPDDDDGFFGSEAGSGVWRSMLAQQLGTSLSKTLDLGLGAKHVKSTHARHGWHPHDELQASLGVLPVAVAKHS